MSLMVLTRRNITFRQPGAGEVTVLLVPGREQVQVVKDFAGVSDAQNKLGSTRGPQLSRVFSGQRYIYGYLPEEVRELRQAVKVWMAEDFAPTDCQAFFYVFSPDTIVHGVREQSDEGQQSWRTAQLVLPGNDPLRALTNAITDYVLANPSAVLCVAVLNQLELYRKLQSVLEPYQITPVPFSTLKPHASLKPLYRHFDHTLLYLTAVIFGLLLLVASSAFFFLNWSIRNKLEREIEDTQTRIKNIQINQSTGHIRQPQALLDTMSKAFNQQPSAIIDAAATLGAQFGDLTQVTFKPPEMVATNGSLKHSNQQDVAITVKKSKDKLLFGQEHRAQLILANRPWVRSIRRAGSTGEQAQLVVTLQTEGAPMPTAEDLRTAALAVSYTEADISPSDLMDITPTTFLGNSSDVSAPQQPVTPTEVKR